MRFDGSGWSRWSLRDSLLDTGFMLPYSSPLGVAPDGGVWFMDPSDDSCEGVGHFDGVTPDRFLSDLCVKTTDIAADGAVWLLATEAGADLRHVYVITPEAVAATE